MRKDRGERQFIRITLYLFQWKTLCKDSFLYFPIFGSINKNKSGENYLWLTEKVWFIFRDYITHQCQGIFEVCSYFVIFILFILFVTKRNIASLFPIFD